MEENKEMYNFTFVSVFYKDAEKLPYEMRCKVMDAICCWGSKRELPHEVENDPVILALISNAQRMIEGQDKFKEQQKENGGKHKNGAIITDEEIIGAYIRAKKKKGSEPTEKEVIEESGKDIKRIASRPIWRDERWKYWKEYVEKGCITIHGIVYSYTQDNTTIQYNTQNCIDSNTSIHNSIQNMEDSKKEKTLFDF